MIIPKAPADPASIPILMEPVATEAAAGGPGTADARPLGREDQQSLFADIPPAAAPERRTRPPAPGPADRLRAAREMLRARAPAIVDEVTAAHQKQLTEALRERLRQELASLLDDLTADPPSNPPH